MFEDATPEMVRDFFWDDEFRSKWDDMLLYSSTLEVCKDTGTMVVQWVRKVDTHTHTHTHTCSFFSFCFSLSFLTPEEIAFAVPLLL